MKVWYVIGILMLAINGTASVYYVDNGIGDDGHDGLSAGRPFRTVRQAMSKLSPGDTLIMASGCVFHESMVFQRSGTPSAPVTVEAGGSILSGREKVPAGNWRQIENGLWLNGNHVQTGALRPRLFNGDGRMISVHFQTKPQDLKEGEAVWNQNGIYYRAAAGE